MILGIVAIGIIAFGGYLIYNKVTKAINTNAPVAVQNVEQLPVKNAETLLHAQGLQTHTVGAPSSTIAATLVISQNPSPGDRVVKDTIVTLTVSTGVPKTTVPALVEPAARAGRDDARERGPALERSTTSARARSRWAP